MSQLELNKAISLIDEGENGQARMIIQSILRQDANNVDAWWLLTRVGRDNDEKRRAVQRVLKLQSDHAEAKALLEELDSAVLEDTQEVHVPSIAELLSQPKTTDLFEDDDEEDIFGFDTTAKSQAPTRPRPRPQARPQVNRSNRKLIVAVATLAIAIMAVVVYALTLTGNSSVETPVVDSLESSHLSEIIQVEENSVGELIIDRQGLVTITAEGIGEFDSVIRVYNHDGIELAYNDDHYGVAGLESYDAAVEFVPVNGYARIEISEFWDEAGSTRVTVSSINDPNIDHNVQVGQAETYHINIAEWFALTVDAEQEISIIVSSENSDFDPVLEVYDANFYLLASNDDHNTSYQYLDTYDSVVEDLIVSGTVYLRVRDYFSDSQGNVSISIK